MKILLVAPQPFYTERGTPIAVRAVVETLAGAGHRIDVLTYHAGNDVQAPEVRIYRASRPALVRRIPIGPSWQKAACDLRIARAMKALLNWGRYDIVHAVEEAAFLAAKLCPRRGVPFIYDMDSLMSEQLRDKGLPFSAAAGLFDRLERWTLGRAAGTLAVCPALVEHARPLAAPGAPVELLPDFPLPGIGEAAPDPEIASQRGVKILYVGNLEGYQGVPLMLQAFSGVAGRCESAHLCVVGGPESEVQRQRRAFADLVGAGRIRLLGPRPPEQLGGLLAAADILVSPRIRGRNTPMKIYSYMASGRAIIATDLPTHTQVLDESTSALAAPTPEALARELERLIHDEELRARLGSAARARVELLYSRRRFEERLLAFYAGLQQMPGSRGDGRRAQIVAAAA